MFSAPTCATSGAAIRSSPMCISRECPARFLHRVPAQEEPMADRSVRFRAGARPEPPRASIDPRPTARGTAARRRSSCRRRFPSTLRPARLQIIEPERSDITTNRLDRASQLGRTVARMHAGPETRVDDDFVGQSAVEGLEARAARPAGGGESRDTDTGRSGCAVDDEITAIHDDPRTPVSLYGAPPADATRLADPMCR